MTDLARYADSVRLVLYHKQASSARTRFLRLGYGSICAFQPLPEGCELTFDVDETSVVPHPGAVIAAAGHWLGLDAGALEFQGEFKARAQLGDKEMSIYLLRFTSTDPPFQAADAAKARFVAITEVRDLPAAELEILRRSYEYIMEG